MALRILSLTFPPLLSHLHRAASGGGALCLTAGDTRAKARGNPWTDDSSHFRRWRRRTESVERGTRTRIKVETVYTLSCSPTSAPTATQSSPRLRRRHTMLNRGDTRAKARGNPWRSGQTTALTSDAGGVALKASREGLGQE